MEGTRASNPGLAAAQTSTPLWFQLYVWGDRSESKEALARARAAGFSALLLSIDTSVRSKREREKRSGLDLPAPHLSLRTFLDGALHPGWGWHFLTSETISFPNIGPPDRRSRDKIKDMFDGTVRWEDLDWIREMWDGNILVKGVMRPEEAVRAADAGLEAPTDVDRYTLAFDRLLAAALHPDDSMRLVQQAADAMT